MLKVFLLSTLLLSQVITFDCISDLPDLKIPYLESTKHQKEESSKERMLQQAYESIRIHADFTYVPSTIPAVRDYIENQLVPSAISYFRTTLRVIRFPQNLTVDPECQGLVTPQRLVNIGAAADLIVLVGADYYDENFVAFAVPCSLSILDNRPVFGALIYNLNFLPMDSLADDEENLSTTLHELTHVLGFGSSLYQYYVDPDTKIELKNHVKSRTVNGITNTFLDVEPLTSRLKTYFNCNTLEGAPLENQGEPGSLGSHFEKKVFMNEFMTATSVTEPVISQFTLALLEGSGWYKVRYNMTEPFTWGKNKGCSFVNGFCMSNSTPNFAEFCGSLTQIGCTYTRRAQGYCGSTPGPLTTSNSLPSQWNYWRNKTIVLDPYANNCPYFIGAPWSDCENPANKQLATLNEETYGPKSRCVTGTLNYPSRSTSFGSYCFNMVCRKQNNGSFTVVITVGNKTVTCTKLGPVSVTGFRGQINCPNPSVFCTTYNPVYCKRGCSGRGPCKNNVCQCPKGWGGADCAMRRYDNNCPRCANQRVNKDCYGNLCRCNPQKQSCGASKLRGPFLNVSEVINQDTIDARESLSFDDIHQALKTMMDPFLEKVRNKKN